MTDLGVIYICRGADPNWERRVERFAESWELHDPGTPCNLYVAFKEFQHDGDWYKAMDALIPLDFEGIYHNENVNRFGGGVFQDACTQIEERLVCTLVSTTEIMHDDWLKRLRDVYDSRGAGLVGCTGSKEGNIHIRDTAIIIDRRLYLDISRQFDFTRSKDGYLDFEHGGNNLTIQVMRAGQPVFVVEKHRVIEPAEWGHTTYRGNMDNVLVHDRGSRDFQDL